MRIVFTLYLFFAVSILSYAQDSLVSPPQEDPRMHDIINEVSATRIEADIKTLVGFGTRHTLSDTLSNTRGIGAARRWIKSEFDKISNDCNGCLEVSYHKGLATAEGNRRIPEDTWIVNVMAVKRGTKYPNKYIIMAGDIDSRVSDAMNGTDDSPGANDNASGMAGVIEASRVLWMGYPWRDQ